MRAPADPPEQGPRPEARAQARGLPDQDELPEDQRLARSDAEGKGRGARLAQERNRTGPQTILPALLHLEQT